MRKEPKDDYNMSEKSHTLHGPYAGVISFSKDGELLFRLGGVLPLRQGNN